MVVDTSALVAILLQEEEAEIYADQIAGAPAALLSAASHVELAIVALSRGARGRAELDATLANAGIEIVVPVTPDQGRLAADAGRRPRRRSSRFRGPGWFRRRGWRCTDDHLHRQSPALDQPPPDPTAGWTCAPNVLRPYFNHGGMD